MANHRSHILTEPDDLQWVRETHLKGVFVRPFVIAEIQGNDDYPDCITLYAMNRYYSPRQCFVPDEEGVYWEKMGA